MSYTVNIWPPDLCNCPCVRKEGQADLAATHPWISLFDPAATNVSENLRPLSRVPLSHYPCMLEVRLGRVSRDRVLTGSGVPLDTCTTREGWAGQCEVQLTNSAASLTCVLFSCFFWLSHGCRSLCEEIRVFSSRDELLSLRETSKFRSSCEWIGSGLTGVLSSLFHVIRQECWAIFL